MKTMEEKKEIKNHEKHLITLLIFQIKLINFNTINFVQSAINDDESIFSRLILKTSLIAHKQLNVNVQSFCS